MIVTKIIHIPTNTMKNLHTDFTFCQPGDEGHQGTFANVMPSPAPITNHKQYSG